MQTCSNDDLGCPASGMTPTTADTPSCIGNHPPQSVCMECNICLDPLDTVPQEDNGMIAHISSCNHYYHNSCITAWVQRTNRCPTCPTCRTRFSKVDLVKTVGGATVSTYPVYSSDLPLDAVWPDTTGMESLDISMGYYPVLQRRIRPRRLQRPALHLIDFDDSGDISDSDSSWSRDYRLLQPRPRPRLSRIPRAEPISRVSGSSQESTRTWNVMSPSEVLAWEMLECAMNEDANNDVNNDVNDSRETNTRDIPKSPPRSPLRSPPRSPPRTYKRPSRRSIISTGASNTALTSQSIGETGQSSEPTICQSLLNSIRNASDSQTSVSRRSFSSPFVPVKRQMSPPSSPDPKRARESASSPSSPSLSPAVSPPPVLSLPPSQPTMLSPSGSPASPASSLDLRSKEQVQSMVRGILRPLYRSGRIDKIQYTSVNQRASRAIYQVISDGKVNNRRAPNVPFWGSTWRAIVHDHVAKELETIDIHMDPWESTASS